MTNLSTIGNNKIWTYRRVLRQDTPNSVIDFTSLGFYQDFTLFGLPANHMILGVKLVTLVSFDPGAGNTVKLYIGNPNVFPASPTVTYVTNVINAYGVSDLTIPSGSGDSYQYGSFRWFSLATPGSNSTISPAYCLPQRTDAHDLVARFVISGGASMSQILSGSVEITIQYGAF